MENQVLNVGIMSRQDYMCRTIAIAKGEYKPLPDEPKIWFESLDAITLTEQDWGVFIGALENSPPPNERLREAFVLHQAHVKQD